MGAQCLVLEMRQQQQTTTTKVPFLLWVWAHWRACQSGKKSPEKLFCILCFRKQECFSGRNGFKFCKAEKNPYGKFKFMDFFISFFLSILKSSSRLCWAQYSVFFTKPNAVLCPKPITILCTSIGNWSIVLLACTEGELGQLSIFSGVQ